jgi:hypothetical protein
MLFLWSSMTLFCSRWSYSLGRRPSPGTQPRPIACLLRGLEAGGPAQAVAPGSLAWTHAFHAGPHRLPAQFPNGQMGNQGSFQKSIFMAHYSTVSVLGSMPDHPVEGFRTPEVCFREGWILTHIFPVVMPPAFLALSFKEFKQSLRDSNQDFELLKFQYRTIYLHA